MLVWSHLETLCAVFQFMFKMASKAVFLFVEEIKDNFPYFVKKKANDKKLILIHNIHSLYTSCNIINIR